MAPRNPPRQRCLRACLAVLGAHLREHGVVDEFAHVLPAVVDRVGVPEGRVLRHVDSVLRVEGAEGFLLQVRVEFHLVGGGHDGGRGEEVGELGVGEVRDADCARFAVVEGLFHGLVGLGRGG